MLRLRPTVIAVTATEVRDYENRWRYRRYLVAESHREQLEAKSRQQLHSESQPETPAPEAKVEGSHSTSTKARNGSSASPRGPRVSSASQSVLGQRNTGSDRQSDPLDRPHIPAFDHQQGNAPATEPASSAEPFSRRRVRPRRAQPLIDPGRDARLGSDHGLPHLASELPSRPRNDRPAEPVSRDPGIGWTGSYPRQPSIDMASRLPASSNTPALPRPFSQTPRRVSAASPASAESQSQPPRNSSVAAAEPPRTSLRTPAGSNSLQTQQDGGSRSSISSTSSRARSLLASMRSLGTRTRSVRAQSGRTTEPAPSSSRLPLAGPAELVPPSPPPQNQQDFQIYSDALPPSEQPRTPHQLPEARHRGRLSGAYTAPTWRSGMAAAAATMTPSGSTGTGRGTGPGTTGRWQPRRNRSPPGLETPGFRGLYGGLENTDDATLFDQASRIRGNPRQRRDSGGEEEDAQAQ